MKFSIKDFFSNRDQITGNCGFGHIYWRNPWWKTSFFAQQPTFQPKWVCNVKELVNNRFFKIFFQFQKAKKLTELVIGESWWELVIMIDSNKILPKCDFEMSPNPAKIAKSNMAPYITAMMSLSEFFDVILLQLLC